MRRARSAAAGLMIVAVVVALVVFSVALTVVAAANAVDVVVVAAVVRKWVDCLFEMCGLDLFLKRIARLFFLFAHSVVRPSRHSCPPARAQSQQRTDLKF